MNVLTDKTQHDPKRHADTSPVYIFWTGGWDSTYRIVELSRMNLTVQPVYCLDKSRRSMDIELNAMKNILDALALKPETKAKFLPTIKINLETLPDNKDITEAYKTVRGTVKLGEQHEWLAKTAMLYPGIEIGIEKPIGALGGCTSALNKFAVMEQSKGIWRIDPEASSREAQLLFGSMIFPIIDINELEMSDNIKKWGYEDVMRHIWFCFSPIDGKPCGLCHPCTLKIERGMGWLLPPEAHKRYRTYKKLEKLYRIPVIGIAFKVIRELVKGLRKAYLYVKSIQTSV